MKKYLAPSILSIDFTKMGEELEKIQSSGAQMAHIDVMDGLFVPSISFGMPVVKSIRKASNLIFDVHMMVTDPERYILDLKESGADIISIHIEACKDPKQVLLKIKEIGATPAIAINPDTVIQDVKSYFQYAEEVLLMSVYPGFGGQQFIEASYDRIKELVQIREELGLEYMIEVDGGIKLDNVDKILECGADVIVAGSAVFGDYTAENTRKFIDKIKKYEV